MQEYAFCMVLHVKWISHDQSGIRRFVVRKIHLAWKIIQNEYVLTLQVQSIFLSISM